MSRLRPTVRRRSHVAVVLALSAFVLSACSDADPVPVASARATGDATSAPSDAPTDDPSGTPTATPSPTAAPTASPTPTPTPTATPTDRPAATEDAALAAAANRRAERPECGSDELPDDFHEVVATTEQGMLTFVVCFLGAYQASGELLLFDGVSLVDVGVEQWVSGTLVTTPEVTGFVGELSGGALVNEVKYRGLGDCGLQQTWDVTDQGLSLRLAREQECSDGGAYVPPDEWPVVYRR